MFLLHLTFPSGAQETLRFSSAFERGLWTIALSPYATTITTTDPPVTPIIDVTLQRVATRCVTGGKS